MSIEADGYQINHLQLLNTTEEGEGIAAKLQTTQPFAINQLIRYFKQHDPCYQPGDIFDLLREGVAYETDYLQWQAVRGPLNPTIKPASPAGAVGSEGYRVGNPPNEVIGMNLRIGQMMVATLQKMNERQWGLMNRVIRTLTSQQADPFTLHTLIELFEQYLPEWKEYEHHSSNTFAYRSLVKEVVSCAPGMAYQIKMQQGLPVFSQSYYLPDPQDEKTFALVKPFIEASGESNAADGRVLLLPANEEPQLGSMNIPRHYSLAWLIASRIPAIGHPLWRHPETKATLLKDWQRYVRHRSFLMPANPLAATS